MSDGPLLVSVRDAARIAGVGRNYGYELVRSGAWPAVRVGRRLLVPRAAIGRWVEEAAQANGSGEAGAG